ncbi:MAG: lipoprotein insertase outer membrane protein LolB [Burkholderiales bacterium]|jgi:outer membrane lipoprotein LolB|nr:lipoprotein insertase outer membrane protein LolB [Burkholderiales bacterium]
MMITTKTQTGAGTFIKNLYSLRLWGICFFVSVVGLTGCATAPVVGNIEDTLSDEEDAPFTVEGRLATKIQQDAVSATFSWSHDNVTHNRDEILLSSPLGTMIAKIQRFDENIKLYRGEKDISVFSLEDGGKAFDHALGFPLPIRELPYWLRGMASPDSPADITHDDINRIATLNQEGWSITYVYGAANRLPDRITAQYGDNALRIKIDRWGR